MSSKTVKVKKKEPKATSVETPQKNASLYPSFLILCHDAIEAKDGTISFIRLIDRVTANGLPARFANIAIIGEFASACVEPYQFRIELKITAPDGSVMPVGPFDMTSRPEAASNRIVLNCQNFGFAMAGFYKFELEAKDLNGTAIGFIGRMLEVRTTGIVEVADPTVI